jgi:hypothetical protein
VALSDGPLAEAAQKLTEGKGANLALDLLVHLGQCRHDADH